MPPRRKAGERERQKGGRIDQGSEDDGPARDAERVRERIAQRGSVALVQVVEEVDLVIFRRAEDGGGDEDGGDVRRGAEQTHPQEGGADGEERGAHRQRPRGGAAEDEGE